MSRALLALIAVGVAACGSGEAASPPSPMATVGDVGRLPGAVGTVAPSPPSAPAVPPTTDEPPASTEEPMGTGPVDTAAPIGGLRPGPVGRSVDGNRVLVIGDSILASTASRYGGELCDRLVPLGWAVEVDAEEGQQIGFGQEVLGDRLDAGWDTAVIMLGNNYDGDPQRFDVALEAILDELAPRPVVLLTVTEFRDDRAEVNYVLLTTAAERDNVRVVDWAARTRDGSGDDLLGGDGLHLSDLGRGELALMTSQALGRAPAGSRGECLSTRYTDDSGVAGRDSGP